MEQGVPVTGGSASEGSASCMSRVHSQEGEPWQPPRKLRRSPPVKSQRPERSRVHPAHYVVYEDGNRVVYLPDNARHACALFAGARSASRWVDGGLRFRGTFGSQTPVHVCYLCHHLQISVRHACAGVGAGIASHSAWALASTIRLRSYS